MTNFILTLTTGKQTVAGTKYNVAPKAEPFKATLDGKPAEAWTTEGRGSAYIYVRQDGVLHYMKVLATDTVAARNGLVVESEEYASKFKTAEVKKYARSRAKKAAA